MFEHMVSLFVSEAWAMGPAPEGGQGGSPLAGFLPLILIFAIFYFLLIRPQQKKAKDHRTMLEAVKKGDKVVTSGGIHGLVEAVGKNTITVKIAENVRVKIGRANVAAIRATEED